MEVVKRPGGLEARDQKEAESMAKHMLFSNVRGYRVSKVLVEEKLDIAREFYLGITYDTVAKEPVAIFSAEGGVDLEDAVPLAEKERAADQMSGKMWPNSWTG